MQLNKKYIFTLVIILLFATLCSINVSASAFGEGGSTTNATGSSIVEKAEDAGKDASGLMAQFQNVDELNAAISKFSGFVRWGIAFLTTLGTLISFITLALAFIRLANAPAHAAQRRMVYIDIGKGIVSTVCFGGLTLLMTIFYKSFSIFIQNTVMLSSEWQLAFAYALVEFKYLIAGIMGVLSLTMFLIFLKDVAMLGTTATNPQKRSEAIKQIIITLVATIGFGGTGIFVAIFNGLVQNP